MGHATTVENWKKLPPGIYTDPEGTKHYKGIGCNHAPRPEHFSKAPIHIRKSEQFRYALYDCVTSEDLRAVALKAVSQAKNGDRYAREWLFNRLLGKATTIIESTSEVKLTTDEVKHRIDQLLGLSEPN